jgi:hypothetical protein
MDRRANDGPDTFGSGASCADDTKKIVKSLQQQQPPVQRPSSPVVVRRSTTDSSSLEASCFFSRRHGRGQSLSSVCPWLRAVPQEEQGRTNHCRTTTRRIIESFVRPSLFQYSRLSAEPSLTTGSCVRLGPLYGKGRISSMRRHPSHATRRPRVGLVTRTPTKRHHRPPSSPSIESRAGRRFYSPTSAVRTLVRSCRSTYCETVALRRFYCETSWRRFYSPTPAVRGFYSILYPPQFA